MKPRPLSRHERRILHSCYFLYILIVTASSVRASEGPPRRSELACSALPAFEEYARLHHKIATGVGDEEHGDGDNDHYSKHIVLHTCVEGFADCLVGSVTVFYFALLTNRGFFRALADVPGLKPNRVKWGVSAEQVEKWKQEGSNVEVAGLNLHVYLNNSAVEAFTSGNLTSVGAGEDTIIFNNNAGLLHRLFANPNYKRRLRSMGLRHDTAFGCAVQFLYKLRPEAAELLKSQFALVRDYERHFTVGIHIRVGDHALGLPTEFTNVEEFNTTVTLDNYSDMFECVDAIEHKFAPPDKQAYWLFLSDSMQLREEAKAKYGDRLVTTTSLPIEHVSYHNSGNGASLKGHYLAAAEWWLFGLTDYQVVGTRGFGRTAAAAHNNWDNVYILGYSKARWFFMDKPEFDMVGTCAAVPYTTMAKLQPGI